MLTRFVRGQLIAFVIVTIVTLTYVGSSFVGIPRMLGFGTYPVTLRLPDASGLYPKALVTYRGVDAGQVSDIGLNNGQAVVSLRINDGIRLPADLTAEVHSTSPVGEQYVNLIPRTEQGPLLTAGSVIPADRATLPVSTSQLLDNSLALLRSIPRDSLRTTVDELYQAFNGSTDNWGLLLDSGIALQRDANANLDPTLKLIEDLNPVLATQQRAGPEIRSWTHDLAGFTAQLALSDHDVRGLIAHGAPFADQLRDTFNDLRPVLPNVLADAATIGEVSDAYLPSIEHILTLYPAALEAVQSITPADRVNDNYVVGNINLKLSVNDPPFCTQGFEFAHQRRDPNDLGPEPSAQNSYCKVPRDDPRIVRGARNNPCPNDADRRSATAAGCGLVFTRLFAPNAPRPATPLGAGSLISAAAASLPEATMPFTDLGHGGWNPLTWRDVVTTPLRP